MGGFEHVEHTADVGICAWGSSLEECFEQATLGVLDIMGAYEPGVGEEVPLTQSARDLSATLVDWLSEVLYITESRDAVVRAVTVKVVSDEHASGAIEIGSRGDLVLEGTAVKAITYHQLFVEESEEGWSCRFFVDV